MCYRIICREGSRIMGPHAHPEVSLHTFPLDRYMSHIYRDQWAGVEELMLSSAQKLASAGAEFLICPDNTIHRVFDAVERKSPLPWLHIAREVAREAKRLGYRKSALLGTKYLMSGAVYPEACRGENLKLHIPAGAVRERINGIIFNELVYGDIREESRDYLLSRIREMADLGCDSVVLGCTELPLIIIPGESPLPVLDSTGILARAALGHALEGTPYAPGTGD